MSNKPTLPIQQAFAFGWKSFVVNKTILITITVLFIGTQFIPDAIQLLTDAWAIIILIYCVSFALSALLMLGIIRISLKLYHNETITFNDIWCSYKLLLPYMGANIVYQLRLGLGFLLFIIPGIIWMIRYFYFGYVMMHEHLGMMEALQRSAEITKGWMWQLFLFGLLQLLIVLVGLAALGVGLVVALPVIFLAEVYIYQFLIEQKKLSTTQ